MLNPGDFAYFSVLNSGYYSSVDFKASARIANVKNLDIIHKAESTKKKIKKITYFYGVFVIFCIVMAFVGGMVIRKENKVKKLFNSENFQIPKPSTKREYEELLEEYFSTRSKKEIADIKNLLLQIEPGAPITDGKHQQIIEEFHRVANKISNSWLNLILNIALTLLIVWWLLDTL